MALDTYMARMTIRRTTLMALDTAADAITRYKHMITLYLMGDKSQPMHLDQGLVIGHNWNIRDGHGAIYTSTPDETKARKTLDRLKFTQPQTNWTLTYDCK